MLLYYLKIAARRTLRHKGYSSINILGLAVGMAVCILIFLWVWHEMSYDRFHANADRLFLVAQADRLATGGRYIAAQPAPLGPVLKERIPEIEDFFRFRYGQASVTREDKTAAVLVCLADPSLFTLLSFPFLQGDPATALMDPHSVVLTERAVEMFFGLEDPMGQTLRYQDQIDLTVTAVIKDIPDNSSLEATLFVPLRLIPNIEEYAGSDYYTCVLLPDGADYALVGEKINAVVNELFGQTTGQEEFSSVIFLHPLTRFHLYSLSGEGGRIQAVYILATIAVIVLIIACMNFINLATARSVSRAREIGLRKVVGASRGQLIRQLLGESFLQSLAAMVIAIWLAEASLPIFNDLAGTRLSIPFLDPRIVGGLAAIVVVTGILAGSVPAFHLSAFRPTRIMKGYARSGRGGLYFRRILVITQFCLSLILIMGTLGISHQLDYIKNKDLGLDKDSILVISATAGIAGHYDTFKAELLKSRYISSVTASAQGITHINSSIGDNWSWEGRNPNEKLEIHFDWVSFDYARTFGIPMAQGRFYSPDHPSDTVDGIVLNETAVRLMGMDAPIGKRFSYWGMDRRIIGVISDFHLEPLYETLKPMILIFEDFVQYVYIRIDPEHTAEALAYIEDTFTRLEPGGIFHYRFLSDAYNRVYQAEYQARNITRYATVLAILIACLGLFGLASYLCAQRAKEIGIRRVLGASVSGVVFTLSKEYAVLVLLAGLVATPVAIYALDRYLGQFAYRSSLPAGLFIGAVIIALGLAIATVLYRSIRVALASPTDAIKSE